MPTPSDIIKTVSSLMNDSKQSVYNDGTVLPYLNMALRELQEIYEENNIPVTNEVSSPVLTVPAGTTVIGKSLTVPVLPANLIEIQQIWESNDGGNSWSPMGRKEFISHNLEQPELSSFSIWAWIDNEIHLPPATSIIQLKLDYIKSLFSVPITNATVDVELGVKFTNIESYLGFATGALCSLFIGENETRAVALSGKAQDCLERSLNIPTKGRQAIMTRRRPFRASYKMRGRY